MGDSTRKPRLDPCTFGDVFAVRASFDCVMSECRLAQEVGRTERGVGAPKTRVEVC